LGRRDDRARALRDRFRVALGLSKDQDEGEDRECYQRPSAPLVNASAVQTYPREKADLLHAIYDRITVAGPEIVGVRLTQAA